MISFDNVTFTYPSRQPMEEPVSQALRDVTFDIHPGEFVSIVGPNGSGKSTVAKLMTGLLHPDKGSVRLHNKALLSYFEAGDLPKFVGLVFQDPDLQSVATVVEEDVAFALENLRVNREEMHMRVREALERVGMWDVRLREPHSLSGGQKQRVAIASVLAPRPACIIFDEATSMLDSAGRKEVNALMRELAAAGHTVISITHHMEEVVQANRVIVLNQGQVVFELPPSELFRNERELMSYHLSVPLEARAANLLRSRPDTSEPIPGFVDAVNFAAYLPKANLSSPDRDAEDGTCTDVSAGGAKGETVIEVTHLSHVYMRKTPMETKALANVSFSVERGEIVALVGQTGSGKSTLSLYMNGLYRPSAGQVRVLGRDVADRKNAKYLRRRVGMLFQKSETQIFESLIGDEIAYGPFRFGASVDEAREAVAKAMELVGLDFSWRDRPTAALSGGQRRKVALASVLAQRPEILVLDEPTAALDPKAQADMMSLLQHLAREENITILFVTHQLEEVAQIADRVLVMKAGQLALDTTPGEWLSQQDAVSQLGFELPAAPQYVLDVCAAKAWPVPKRLPLTMDEACAWLTQQLRSGR